MKEYIGKEEQGKHYGGVGWRVKTVLNIFNTYQLVA
jgi:hypothetical protein